MGEGSPHTVLIAEDNEIDRLMASEAWTEGGSSDELRFVQDGQELMDYLNHRGKYAGQTKDFPRPGLILIDLKLPVKSGFEALKEIKADPDFRRIPIVIMTASKAKEDKMKAYEMDAKCFVTKPGSLKGLVTLMKAVHLLNDPRLYYLGD